MSVLPFPTISFLETELSEDVDKIGGGALGAYRERRTDLSRLPMNACCSVGVIRIMLSAHGRGYAVRGREFKTGLLAIRIFRLTGVLATATPSSFSGERELLTFLTTWASEGAFRGLFAIGVFSREGGAILLFVGFFASLLQVFTEVSTAKFIVFGTLTGLSVITLVLVGVVVLFSVLNLVAASVVGIGVPGLDAGDGDDGVGSVRMD